MQLTALTQLLAVALMATMPIAQAAPVDVAQADVALAPRHHKGAGGGNAAAGNPASALAGLFGGKGAAKNNKRHHKGAGGGKAAAGNPASALAGLFGGKGAAKNNKRHHKGAGGGKAAAGNPASALAGLFGAGKGN
ncbi:hypothetical protein DL95DRAFT_528748 [Leptodontidium sp. 2 PMI_412]|nr:hypothetical protein DL95DRAFT_528748 [Leptodontidium sp. 2 PMI_412]